MASNRGLYPVRMLCIEIYGTNEIHETVGQDDTIIQLCNLVYVRVMIPALDYIDGMTMESGVIKSDIVGFGRGEIGF